MGRRLDYDAAREVLAAEYDLAEQLSREGHTVAVPDPVAEAVTRVFQSATESHREVLIGLALARILDPEIDLHLPYMKLGENPFMPGRLRGLSFFVNVKYLVRPVRI